MFSGPAVPPSYDPRPAFREREDSARHSAYYLAPGYGYSPYGYAPYRTGYQPHYYGGYAPYSWPSGFGGGPFFGPQFGLPGPTMPLFGATPLGFTPGTALPLVAPF